MPLPQVWVPSKRRAPSQSSAMLPSHGIWPAPARGHRQTPVLILTRAAAPLPEVNQDYAGTCLPGTVLCSGRDKGGLCLCWEWDPSSHPQGRTEAGQEQLHAGRAGRAPAPIPITHQPLSGVLGGSFGGSGLGTPELPGIPLLRGDAHVHLQVT